MNDDCLSALAATFTRKPNKEDALSVEIGLNVLRNTLWNEAQILEDLGRRMDEPFLAFLLGLGYVIAALQEGRYASSDEMKWAVQDCITRNWGHYERREK